MRDIRELAAQVEKNLKAEKIEKYVINLSEKETKEFNLEGTEFTLYRTLFDNSVGVTSYIGSKCGSVAGNDFSEEGLKKTVNDSVLSAQSAMEDPAKDFAPDQGKHEFVQGAVESDEEKFFDRIKEFQADVAKQYPKIRMMLTVGKHVSIHSIMRNTNGTEVEKREGYYSFMSEFAGNDGEKTTGLNAGGINITSLDKPFIENDSIRMHLEEAVAQLNLVPLSGKFEGTVVMTPDAAGQFVSYLLSNYISDNVVLDGTGLWIDKVGEKVADDKLTLVFDPEGPGLVCPSKITGDGFMTEKTTIIENGVLKLLLIGLYTANKTGRKPTKCAFDCAFITPGTEKHEEIVKKVKKGLILGGFSGGSPSTNGEFSGVAKNSFLVEDGEIKGAVAETMVNGNLGEMFGKIVAISCDTHSDGNGAMPYITFDGVVISGK